LASSCSSLKQVFYFQPGPATPLVKQQPPAELVYTCQPELRWQINSLHAFSSLMETKMEKALVKRSFCGKKKSGKWVRNYIKPFGLISTNLQ